MNKNVLLYFLCCMLFISSLSHAATLTVTNTNDSGAGSLRQAIADASSGDTITFSLTGTITLASKLSIDKSLTINGPGSGSLTISGNNSDRVFELTNATSTVNINNVTIANGKSTTYGGGIENEATLNIADCVVTGCSANGLGNGFGGGIDNYFGTLTVVRCLITGNSSTDDGGGVAGYEGSITITDSTIDNNTSERGGGVSQMYSGVVEITGTTLSGNQATSGSVQKGGAIFCKAGTLTLINSTLSQNSATHGGGIADEDAVTMTIINCTIVKNSATTQGGGMNLSNSAATIKNTIIAANTSPDGANFYNGGYGGSGSLNSQGYNACDAALDGFNETGDQVHAALNIGDLADNGGSTQTHALLTGSAAIDAIPEGGNSYNGSPANDQTGKPRPQGGNADIGAFEKGTAPTATTQAVSSISTTTAAGNGTITGLGFPNPTAHGVCWNTTGYPTTSDSKTDEGSASSTGSFISDITELSPYTAYYARAYATNDKGTSYGTQVSFTTNGLVSAVTTQAVTTIAATTATGNGNVISLGIPNPTAHGVCWNTGGTPTTGDSLSNQGVASATGAFTANITHLTPNTTYYVRAFTINPAGTSYGPQVSFTTAHQAPTVTTQAATSVSTTTATGHGNITALGTSNPTAHGICWDTSANPTTSSRSINKGAASATGAFTGDMTGLAPGTTYHYRAYATSSAGTVYGQNQTFHTVTDRDHDGMPDTWETENGLNPDTDDALLDSDKDGLSNLEEFQNGTRATLADSDNDGIPDGWEIENALNPLADDASLDPDNDTYSNIVEYRSGTNPNDPASTPVDPVADAGPDQLVPPGAVVTLNGLNSFVSDGTITGYAWEQLETASVSLKNNTHPECTFQAGDTKQEALRFQLTVTDNKGIESSDTIIVNISENGKPPEANAGAIQSVGSHTDVTLNGSASSDDETVESYLWEQTGGDAVALTSPTSPNPVFSTGGIPEQSLTFQLTITDNDGLKSCDTTTVNVLNILAAPVSNAGSDQTVKEGSTIILDGTGSTDPAGDKLSYHWKQLSGPDVTFSDPTSPSPSCVAPAVDAAGTVLVFELVVTTATAIKDSDLVTIDVTYFHDAPTLSGVPVVSHSGDILIIGNNADSGITSIHALDPDSISEDLNRPDEMPYGLFDFNVKCLPGETIQVHFNLPKPAPSDFGWYKYDPRTGWSDFSQFAEFSPDRSRVSVTLTDGGLGDADGTVNGSITDPSGLGILNQNSGGSDTDSDSDRFGGCFINALR